MVQQRTMIIYAWRGHMTEYGLTGVTACGVTAMLKALHERQGELTAHARSALHGLAAQLKMLTSDIDRMEAQILVWQRADETRRRLALRSRVSARSPRQPCRPRYQMRLCSDPDASSQDG